MDVSIDDISGQVSASGRGVVAYIQTSNGQQTLTAQPFGPVLAAISDDGTISAGHNFGPQLGFVDLDGRVHRENSFGPVVGTVQPPHLGVKAALMLLEL